MSQGVIQPWWTYKDKDGSPKENGVLLSEKEVRVARWAGVTDATKMCGCTLKIYMYMEIYSFS